MTTYVHDDAGNRATATTTGQTPVSYSWDAEGELTATGNSSFIYDADGNRILRTDPTGTTVYAGGQEIKIASNGTVNATRYYSFAGTTVAVRTDRGLGNGVTSLVDVLVVESRRDFEDDGVVADGFSRRPWQPRSVAFQRPIFGRPCGQLRLGVSQSAPPSS